MLKFSSSFLLDSRRLDFDNQNLVEGKWILSIFIKEKQKNKGIELGRTPEL